jgi:hypothetical protein
MVALRKKYRLPAREEFAAASRTVKLQGQTDAEQLALF